MSGFSLTRAYMIDLMKPTKENPFHTAMNNAAALVI